MGYQEDSRRLLLKFLNLLDKKEKTEMLAMSSSWANIQKSLENRIAELSKIENLSRNQLYQLEQYKQFLLQAKEQISIYSASSAELITKNQLQFAKLGIQSVGESLDLLGVKFNQLPLEAIKTMIGFTQDGTPLYTLLNKSYPETILKITNVLVESMALGRNPRVTARLIKEAMNGNLTRALTVARTEQLRSFREASREQMRYSGVVTGWAWLAEPDACPYCLEQNGKEFELNTPMDTHPNCRCGERPLVD